MANNVCSGCKRSEDQFSSQDFGIHYFQCMLTETSMSPHTSAGSGGGGGYGRGYGCSVWCTVIKGSNLNSALPPPPNSYFSFHNDKWVNEKTNDQLLEEKEDLYYLMMYSTHFCLQICDFRHMVKDHRDYERKPAAVNSLATLFD